jgi:hypothetical protein
MAGKIKKVIDQIIKERAKGNIILTSTTRTKIILKGIVPEKFSERSPDDPEVLAKLKDIGRELGVDLNVYDI